MLVVNEIVSLAKIMGLEVDNNDIAVSCGRTQRRAHRRKLYGISLCFTARSCEGEFVRGGGGNSKVTSFCNKRNDEIMGNCCIVH
ncbi:hypothetical protein AVEN_215163-1 [Araneus ventricosus]|uniref:Uncharacterized protein n=1 Tax=Araneus ventricosus TaxID=182803 RepID=A0A4Y2FRQ5_ARAVE|nr:hypothetical protein AVEN_215163-1 [Araneus ventricosus]